MVDPIPLLPPAFDDSVQGKQEKLVSQVQTQTKFMIESQIRWVNQLIVKLWKNPDGLTPQQAFDAFEASAAIVHAKLMTAITNINAFVPGSIVFLEPKAVTSNSDGTVTVAS